MPVIVNETFEHRGETYESICLYTDEEWTKIATLFEEVFKSEQTMNFYVEVSKHDYCSIDVDREMFGKIFEVVSVNEIVYDIMKVYLGEHKGQFHVIGSLMDVARFDLGFEYD